MTDTSVTHLIVELEPSAALAAVDLAFEHENLARQHPQHQTDRVLSLHTTVSFYQKTATDKRTLLLHGMAISTSLSGESVLQKAMTGILT